MRVQSLEILKSNLTIEPVGSHRLRLTFGKKMTEYTPTVTKEDIDRIIERDYSLDGKEQVWDILKLYGYGEAFRIYAAALKEGKGNLEQLKKMIEFANRDYRDLLVAAEYPTQMNECFGPQAPETIRADKMQYYDWFNK